MNVATAIEPVTVFKTRSAQLIDKARNSKQPIIITQNGKATAVLQDVASYEAQRRTLLLLKLLTQGDQEATRGEMIGHTAARQHFEKKIRELQNA